jgi:hypothetical protein
MKSTSHDDLQEIIFIFEIVISDETFVLRFLTAHCQLILYYMKNSIIIIFFF